MWNALKRFFGTSPDPGQAKPANQTNIPWIPADQNPWGVPVLDVRPVTFHMLACSQDPQCAKNAISYGRDDGVGFLDQQPPVAASTPCALTYRRDRLLADGPLFIPAEMEHKWAIYFLRGRILCVRSWMRQVHLTARVEQEGDSVTIREITGRFTSEGEAPELTIRTLDYLLRSHVLGLAHPVPLPAGMEHDPYQAALWCMSMFGNKASVATPHVIPVLLPENPLRSHSLLHIAVARGDGVAVRSHLASGIPSDLLAGDGLAPLHWALSRPDTLMLELLVEAGSSIDVRSAEGATPLMTAVQSKGSQQVEWLLLHGADPNLQDSRGFTALHRVAEMGNTEFVRMLLAHGARADLDAQGHTAASLAKQRGHADIMALLS